jgi:hypothetical protein
MSNNRPQECAFLQSLDVTFSAFKTPEDGAIQHKESGFDRLMSEGLNQKCFADTRWSQQQYIGLVAEKSPPQPSPGVPGKGAKGPSAKNMSAPKIVSG